MIFWLRKQGVTFGLYHKLKESVILYWAAKIIGKIILEHRTEIPFPLRPEDINEKNIQIPNLLYNHLVYVSSGLVSQFNSQLRVRILSTGCPKKVSEFKIEITPAIFDLGNQFGYFCKAGT